jgi:hypothetical protein
MSQSAPAGFFSGTNGLDPSSKLPYFPANFSGEVQLDACKGITSRSGDRAFIAEVTVLTSNLAALAPEDESYVAVGSRRSWYQSMKETGTGYPACIGFLYAAMGLDKNKDRAKIEAEVKPHQDRMLNAAVSDKNPLAGARMHLDTSGITTKKGSLFTLHNFMPVAPVQVAAAVE